MKMPDTVMHTTGMSNSHPTTFTARQWAPLAQSKHTLNGTGIRKDMYQFPKH